MNKIEAIIRPEKLPTITNALAGIGLLHIKMVHLTDRGSQKDFRTGSRGTTRYLVGTSPRMKLEMVVSDTDTERAVATIVVNARTGNIGDGEIFVSPVTEVIRIHTGEAEVREEGYGGKRADLASISA